MGPQRGSYRARQQSPTSVRRVNLGNREDYISRYDEAMALSSLETRGAKAERLIGSYPPGDNPLRAVHSFSTVYRRYDERFVFAASTFAPRNLTPIVQWLQWDPTSSVFDALAFADSESMADLDYEPRMLSEG